MARGSLRKIILQKGYGFIRPDEGGDDVFFHHTSVVGANIEDLNRGQAVSYDVVPGPDASKGPRAVNVQPLD